MNNYNTKKKRLIIIFFVVGVYFLPSIILILSIGRNFVDTIIYAKAAYSIDGTITFENHEYVSDDFDKFPDGNNLKQVAWVADPPSGSKIKDFVNYIFNFIFPSRLYTEKDKIDSDNNIIWERGLMNEAKFKKIE